MAAAVEEAIMTLLTLSLPDDQATIAGLADTHYSDAASRGSQVDYADVPAFSLNLEHDTKHIMQLETLLSEAREMLAMLYTYRACVKALPQLSEGPEKLKSELYWETFKVLDLEISKLRKLQQWQAKACRQVAADLGAERRSSSGPSWSHLRYLVKILDSLLVLDFMKNLKTSFINDFMWYKRTYPVSHQAKDEGGERRANEELQVFLTGRWSILNTLKREVARVGSVEEMTVQLVGYCVENLEGAHTVRYRDRLALLRALPLLLALLAPSEKEGEAVFKKRLKLDRILQPLRREPVVAAFEEVHIVPGGILVDLSPFFKKLVEEGKFELPSLDSISDSEAASVYGILPNLPAIQAAHDNFCLRFAAVNSKLRMVVESPARPGMDSSISSSRAAGFGAPLAREALGGAAEGVVLLHAWGGLLAQHFAWKGAHPLRPEEATAAAAEQQLSERGTVSSYERAVRFNLNRAEKKAMLDLLGRMKGVAAMMMSNAALFQQAIREAIHGEVQEFVRAPLSALLKKHGKKTRSEVVGMLLHLRAIVADWMGTENTTIPRKSRSRMGGSATPIPIDLEQTAPVIPRAVPPSPAQLHALLHIAHSLLLGSPSAAAGGLFAERDLAANELRSLHDFLHRLLLFPEVLDYHGTILEATNVGFLWFREWYLELNRVLQFPVECSIPWMLVECVLEELSTASDAPFMDAALVPFGIYADAANSAMHTLRQQFLYDEVEAEVEFCFGQLVLRLGDQIYSHYKAKAASSLLDKSFFSMAGAKRQSSLRVLPLYYEALLGQRHVQLLGRSINLSALLAQRMNKNIRKSLYVILDYLDGNDLCMVVGVYQQLEILRAAHQDLEEHLPLDPFPAMLAEASNAASLISFSSRVASYVLREVEQDLLPNFLWNSVSQRFVRTGSKQASVSRRAVQNVEDPFLFGTKELTEAYKACSLLFSRFVGLPHMRALVALLGPHSLPLVVQRCLELLTKKIMPALSPKVEELLHLMPNLQTTAPLHSSAAEGLQAFRLQLSAVAKLPQLPAIVGALRSAGSLLAFLSLLDCALRETETVQLMQSAPWLGVVPGSDGELQQLPAEVETGDSPDMVAAPFGDLLQKAAASAPAAAKELFGILQAAQVAEAMYWSGVQGESVLAHSLSVLGSSLSSLKDQWARPASQGETSAVQFHCLFSFIQFMSCNESGPAAADGSGHDALFWGGCTLVYLLGQERIFELQDYTYHILRLADLDAGGCGGGAPQEKKTPGSDVSFSAKDLNAFLERARRAKGLHEHLLSMLKAHVPQPPGPAYVINVKGQRTPTAYPAKSIQQQPVTAGSV